MPDALQFDAAPHEVEQARREATKNLGRWVFGTPWPNLTDEQRSRCHLLVQMLEATGELVVLRADGELIAYAWVTPDKQRLLFQYTVYTARGFGLEKMFTATFGPALLGFCKAAH